MKIIFFGDSITEAGRNVQDPADLGEGYVKLAAQKLRLLYPETQFEILNRGISGDRTEQLLLRIEKDVVEEKPDCVCLQVGINDVWHRFLIGVEVTPEEFRVRYEEIVRILKTTGARFFALQPYALNMDGMSRLRPFLNRFNGIIGEIAAREGMPVVPMDEIFTGVTQDILPSAFSVDGVHPTHRGCRYIADRVVKEIGSYLK